MTSRKKPKQPAPEVTALPKDEPPPSSSSKRFQNADDYANGLKMAGKKQELREYDAYVKEHSRRIRQLERELRGIQVPGDHDGGY